MKLVDEAIRLGACKKVARVKDFDSLARLFFTPQGREFCLENDYPSLEQFRGMNLEGYPVYVDTTVVMKNQDVALINSHGELTFDGVDKAYTVLLMHGATANIHASNYAVVLVEGDGARVFTDETAKVLQ